MFDEDALTRSIANSPGNQLTRMPLDRSIRRSALVVVTVVIYAWCTVAVNGQQKFIETPPPYQEVSSGNDVQLRCRVQNKSGQCFWQKDRKAMRIYPPKYEWASSRDDDCTLLIRRASLDFDQGLWECQVTFSDFTRQDALTSLPSKLLVRVKPWKPRMEYGGIILGPNTDLILTEGQDASISCISRYGNPPALIKWFIGDKEMSSLWEQSNTSEVENPRTWAAYSFLQVRGQRENHGLPIRCMAVHPSSSTPASTESRLDVRYLPKVRLETSPQPLTDAPEDQTSFLSLKCLADANPAASIKWFKDSIPLETSADITTSLAPLTENRTQIGGSLWTAELHFEPVNRQDAGLYSCKATNTIGESDPATYRLDVQYIPRLKKMNENDSFTALEETALLGSTVEAFKCPEFDANPPAQYKWVHLRGGTSESAMRNHVQNRGGGRRLYLENIMWSDDGEYRCIAFNTINGVRRETTSEVHYVLRVTGPPEIQARPLTNNRGVYESIGWVGEHIHTLKSRFCSRPPPRLVAWQWGSSHIQAGENIHPKYEAMPLEPIIENGEKKTNCYWAELQIKDLQKEDARKYTLVVESEKGRDSTNIKLTVKDSTEMRIIAAAAAISLLFLLILISVCVWFLLRIRRRRYHREVEEEGSIAADALYSNGASMDRQRTINSSHAKTFASKPSLDNGQSAYNYSHFVKQARAMSPEALKVRRAPAVLQPPTIV